MRLKHFVSQPFWMIVIIIMCYSCSSSSDDGCPQSEQDAKQQVLQQSQLVVGDAQVAYAQNATTENCLAYKMAFDAYVVALRDWVNCLDENLQAQWQPLLSMEEQHQATIQC